VLGIKYRKIL